ncbi:unnamed protein product [Protopolystoma xenopodis]|uniref:Uncharacterized protein n=1 Tax=Protopolystoma xenopodis TaxID=117903 RepID=A0A3S5B040_9PLAT|nr:unnamed protein product [Protopolystoma xenopodis]
MQAAVWGGAKRCRQPALLWRDQGGENISSRRPSPAARTTLKTTVSASPPSLPASLIRSADEWSSRPVAPPTRLPIRQRYRPALATDAGN